ncbi:hypothetical protein B0J17DRAFT_661293 [Rhizoctonia solani]|nr:hypothetical protein B0J17DRAFT_661293 [Rhizoctonia solani]
MKLFVTVALLAVASSALGFPASNKPGSTTSCSQMAPDPTRSTPSPSGSAPWPKPTSMCAASGEPCNLEIPEICCSGTCTNFNPPTFPVCVPSVCGHSNV